MKALSFVLLLALVCCLSTAVGQIPRTISYQGVLSDTLGNPKPDGPYIFSFRLYSTSSATQAQWTEIKVLQTKRGLFSTVLGDVTPLPDSVRFDRQYWLGIQIGTDPELAPRIGFNAVAYSMSALRSDTARYALNAPQVSFVDSSRIAGTVPNGSLTAEKIASSQVVKSINTLKDDVILAPGSNVSITLSGDTLKISAAGGGGGGTITAINAGAGLTGGGTSGTVTLAIADSGVTNAKLARASVSSEKLSLPLSVTTTPPSTAFSVTTTNNSTALWGQSNGSGGIGVRGQADAGAGVYGQSTSATGTYGGSTNANGVYGWSSTGTGVYGVTNSGLYAIDALCNSNNGTGIRGQATGTGSTGVYGTGTYYGLYGTSTTGDGVRAITTSGYGVYGFSSSGEGVYGGTSTGAYAINGVCNSTNGTGVRGNASGAGSTGVSGSAPTYGVYGATTGTSGGVGVYGLSNVNRGAEGDGAKIGVAAFNTVAVNTRAYLAYKDNDGNDYGAYMYSDTGVGVYGQTFRSIGVEGVSDSSVGVFGHSAKSVGVEGVSDSGWAGVYGSGRIMGVWGVSSDAAVSGWTSGGNAISGWAMSGDGYAGYFNGNVYVGGTLSKSAGSFKIDHPLDPANKYLYHSFVESPDMKNVYDGIAVLDGDGRATVQLPAYFQALNRDYRYQLTCIGGYAPVYIGQEISDNAFVIAGGSPGMKVSWQVTGIRQDDYAKAHPIIPEVEKTGSERGKYLTPKEHGVSETLGINYERRQAMQQRLDQMKGRESAERAHASPEDVKPMRPHGN